ncbi:hypothetical protein [Paraburkholderia sp.]|jgi:hypothetical protein|uniref:hypothetical protein n=1 Tax=Paraburkholderia sp. TaxID=1926495 RepID=UPI002F3E760D
MQSTSAHPRTTGIKPDDPKSEESRDIPPDTLQSRKDRLEKSKHPESENALESSQDKNPIPPESTRE